MENLLKDKVAVITGGTRGIGLATAKAFAKAGAKVIIFGSREETVQKALEELSEINLASKGYWPNLSNFKEVQNTFKTILENDKHIDILVNNAGISASSAIEDTSEEDFAQIMDLNVRGLFHCCKAITPIMKEQGGGVILNTSSMVSLYGQPSGVGYPASKFAVNGITKSLARELAPHHIRVNAVAPGIINTDMVASLPEEVILPLIESIPLGRIGEPEDIANAFLYLASDLASYVTGHILSVDGAARS